MIDYDGLEQRLSEALGLGRRPVAVTFRDAPPPGVARFVTGIGYIKMEEVPGIPRLSTTPGGRGVCAARRFAGGP